MKTILKTLKLIIFLFLSGILLFINIKIHTGPDLTSQDEIEADALKQLNFIGYKLKRGNMGLQMQQLFPEGYFFSNVLYGLSWCELAIGNKNNKELTDTALVEARYAWQQLNSDMGKQVFSENLHLKYGVFYRGWKNYLLGKIITCQRQKDSTELAVFTEECKQIANAFATSETPFLESYSHASWPADAFLAIASLKIYDKEIENKYDSLITEWITKVKKRRDDYTQMIPHSVDYTDGSTLEGARGSSISLILRILSEIDPKYASELFQYYKKSFSMTILGFPAIREYPKGKEGRGDVDSGPIVFGIGFSGTIVGIGALKCLGEYEAANILSSTIETFGIPISKNKQKKYILGKLPIADAFICWSRVSQLNPEIIKKKGVNNSIFGQRKLVHFYGIIVFTLLFLLFYGKWLVRKVRTLRRR